MNINHFCHWFWLSDHFMMLQATPFADEACETIIVCLEEWRVVGRKTRNFCFAVFAAISKVSTCHLCAWEPCTGICPARVLMGNTKQATGEGKEVRLKPN